ncbi:hypothetical protein ACQY0O_003898 [Thecaphora frezii]
MPHRHRYFNRNPYAHAPPFAWPLRLPLCLRAFQPPPSHLRISCLATLHHPRWSPSSSSFPSRLATSSLPSAHPTPTPTILPDACSRSSIHQAARPLPSQRPPDTMGDGGSGSGAPSRAGGGGHVCRAPSGVPSQQRQPHQPQPSSTSRDRADQSTDQEAQWSLKDIYWRGSAAKIITQNQNGPCSLIALCNVLLLRGDIAITPPDRPIVTYSYLSELIADYLLAKSAAHNACHSDPELDLGAALSILPRTQHGLDVDVRFASHDAFNTAAVDNDASGAGELALFKLCGVPLVHGWLADPSDVQTYAAVLQAESYNRAADIVVRGDELAKGAVVQHREVGQLARQLDDLSVSKASTAGGIGSLVDPASWSEQESVQVHQALLIQQFLDSTSTQLTYHGLFVLAQAIQPGQLVALFRNSHVSVLYRRLPDEGGATDETPALFTLVTDSAFLLEDEIVWESLVDVDGASSEFFDGKLRKATLRSGDFVGGQRSAGGGSHLKADRDLQRQQQNEDADYALAVEIHQREQNQLEEARRRRELHRGLARPGTGPRPTSHAPGSSYNGQYIGSSHAREESAQSGYGYSQGSAAAAAASTAPIVPTEVFTTMRYQVQPIRLASNAEVSLVDIEESPSVPVTRTELDALVKAMLPAELVRRKESQTASNAGTTAAAGPSTNPFLSGGEAEQPTVVAPPNNPFTSEMVTGVQTEADGATLDPQLAAHRLARHVPLLAEHLKRLEAAAAAMCRIYSQAWSATLLRQRRVLERDEVLRAIEEALAHSPAAADGIEVRGIRVAIKRDGKIQVHLRDLTPFPASLSRATPGSLAGRPPLPSVRVDTEPTRVRALDLEPVAFNKTDARGFYEAAKARVSADASVLSGVRPEDGRCFDVVMWTDEEVDDDAAAAATTPSTPKVTETSIANVIVEFFGTAATRARGGGSTFVTPPTHLGMLNGLLRSHLVEAGLVEERVVRVEQLRSALEAGEARLWLCNSLRGMWEAELVENLAFQLPASAAAGEQRQKAVGGKKRFSTILKRPSATAAAPSETSGEANGSGSGKAKVKGQKDEKCSVM